MAFWRPVWWSPQEVQEACTKISQLGGTCLEIKLIADWIDILYSNLCTGGGGIATK